MTFGGKTRSHIVTIFTNSSSVSPPQNVDSVKQGCYSLSFDAPTYITALSNSLIIPQGAFQRASATPVRMGLTNVVQTSSNLKSSQAHEPQNVVTAVALWTRGGRCQALTESDDYIAQPGFISYAVINVKD